MRQSYMYSNVQGLKWLRNGGGMVFSPAPLQSLPSPPSTYPSLPLPSFPSPLPFSNLSHSHPFSSIPRLPSTPFP